MRNTIREGECADVRRTVANLCTSSLKFVGRRHDFAVKRPTVLQSPQFPVRIRVDYVA